ncbi:OmpP1/FadL family transporter [Parabacteroides chinchillae]|uniref:Outer membrane protein transport protein (OMPP1/FadL/TodX) n=1 Tax=Parabacteroides chinchillae TaxID=871327 RepID=A0A8G2F988_9BACT|nr:outer membrane protein transport protein [Parabacteroides chinchillae]SEF41002.1 Outer membrane protein transport protein (OMPP1/FadL/TodX) [Parabacteroides chinchillae]
MKKILIVMSALALYSSAAFSQGELDAFRFVQNDLNGTARYLSMGGAFGALGGDISAMHSNPAGLAIYRSSEIVTTLSLSSVSAKSDWLGNKVDNSRTRVNFDNIAYVGYFPTSNDAGLVSWNVGFSYNRAKNYSRNYTMSTGGGLNTSLSDYIAELSTRLAHRSPGFIANDLKDGKGLDPYANDLPWMSVLGYNAGFMNPIGGDRSREFSSSYINSGTGEWLKQTGADLNVTERGAIDQYNIAFGLNFSDVFLLGGTLAITDLNYDYSSWYNEVFTDDSNLKLENSLSTDGTGYSFNIGAIVRPSDYFRLGVAYNSPVWYKMTDYFYAKGSSRVMGGDQWATTPDGAYSNYQYRSPDKWLFSAAAIIGKYGLISVDYELTNYKNMKMYFENGNENLETNTYIKEDFGIGNTLRVGAEARITPQFSVRAGYAWSGSPVKADLRDQKIETVTVGTIPNYTIDRGVNNYTIGLGYRFTPNFYADLAYVYTVHKEDAYNFSNLYPMEDGDIEILNQGATLKTNTTRVALTLGYKF